MSESSAMNDRVNAWKRIQISWDKEKERKKMKKILLNETKIWRQTRGCMKKKTKRTHTQIVDKQRTKKKKHKSDSKK